MTHETHDVHRMNTENPSPASTGREDRLAPMREFYAAIGRPLPAARFLRGDAMPQPARSLLVHDDDMTPTLERWHKVELTLRTLDRHESASTLSRMVVLESIDDATPAEFGMIRIHLDRFDDEARREITGCRVPLGTILNRRGIAHTCHPSAYFAVTSDELINDALGLAAATTLYGRCNVLLNEAGRPLAEVVEILTPVE